MSRSRFGPLTLPFDLTPLGAPGNWLYVSLDLLLPITLTQDAKGKWGGGAGVPLPNVPFPVGLKLFGQVLLAHQQSNRLGVVFSNCVELQFDSKPGAPTNAIGSADPSSATGVSAIRWGGPIGGPVEQLTGVGFN